jgi:transcriptional regulator with XRE-family HTH domain
MLGTMRNNEKAARKAAAAVALPAFTAKGLQRKELAELIGVSPDTIGDFLAGNRLPVTENQGKIEAALGLPSGSIQRAYDDTLSPSALPSDLPHTVEVVAESIGERKGNSIITVRADAIGVTVTIDYDGPEDRRRALAEAMWALGIERGGDDDNGVLHTKGGDK